MSDLLLKRIFQKSRIPIPILFLAIVHFSCEGPTDAGTGELYFPPLPAFDVQWGEQNTLVCFGTSLTYGYGAGEKRPFGPIGAVGSQGPGIPGGTFTGDSSYPRFLSEELKIKVLNKGYTGARTSYALTILDDSILSQKPALVLLEFGANDFLWNTSSHIADSLLSLLVSGINQYGAKIVLVSFVHPDMVQFMAGGGWSSQDSLLALDYFSMFTSVAQRYSLPLIAYPLQGVFGRPNMMSDPVHPNGAGYKRMEDNIFNALRPTFEKNGMLN